MADGETGAADSILRRMIGARRDEAPPPLTVHRALRLALSQLADEMFELDIEVRGIEDEQVDQSGAAQTLLEHAVFSSSKVRTAEPGWRSSRATWWPR